MTYQFLSDKVGASNVLMNDIKEELACIKKETAQLRLKNETLNLAMSDLQERMRNIEQYSRRNNIKVSGIPISPQEDVKLIVKDLGAALGVEGRGAA